MPSEAIVKQPKTTKQKAVAKERAHHLERGADFEWLKQSADLQKLPMDVVAKRMGGNIEEAYTMFAHTLEKK